MRLTLRTLLAWLDDTLPPEEVREIGKQVSETPYAQQLIERIRRVTRRRRLTVPPNSGADAVDPNIVAAYLDNELEAEKVAEYEKTCLDSDLHLAEAASCHQVLSLIKNKAKVPPEARYRMYRLLTGSQAVRTSYRGAAAGGSALLGSGVVPSAVPGDSEPPWAQPAADRPAALDRLGPPLLAVALIVTLVVVGWLNLRNADELAREAGPLVAASPDPAGRPAPDGPPAPGLDDRPGRPAPGLGIDGEGSRAGPPGLDEALPAEADVDADAEADVDAEAGSMPAEPGVPLPEGVAGVVEEAEGVALRATREGAARGWERLKAGDELDPGDRVLNLAPFRTTVGLGPVRATMVAQSEIRVQRPDGSAAARLDLIDGGLVLRSEDPGQVVEVGFEGRTVAVEPPAGRPVGLSVFGLRAPGEEAGGPMLAIMTPDGALAVGLDGDDEPRRFEGSTLVRIDPEVGLLGAEAAVMPRWVVDPEPPPAEARAGEAFAALFGGSTGEITFVLLEGIEGEDADVRNLSVAALGAMSGIDPDNLELVLTVLNRPGDPGLRATALDLLSRRMARGPDEAAEVRGLIGRFVAPPEAADDLIRLLIGYGDEQLGDGDALAGLVADLSSPNPSVRQLALETLRALTGREAHGYDPDNPQGAGLEYWQGLLKSGRLVPIGRPAPSGPNGGNRDR